MGTPINVFLSTPSARRATCCSTVSKKATGNFYPRPPRGGRQGYHTHTVALDKFLSTPSARRATRSHCPGCSGPPISIHALREEGDMSLLLTSTRPQNFYPRPPRGGRPCRDQYDELQRLFLSTPSARRATVISWLYQQEKDYFYPRPPRGGRLYCKLSAPGWSRFLSTPSARRATKSSCTER